MMTKHLQQMVVLTHENFILTVHPSSRSKVCAVIENPSQQPPLPARKRKQQDSLMDELDRPLISELERLQQEQDGEPTLW